MSLTPVEATVIASAVGATASIIASTATALLTQRSIRLREAALKIWERRADALEEAHRSAAAHALARRVAHEMKRFPQAIDSAQQEEVSRLVDTKLALYTSSALVDAHKAAWTAFTEWLVKIAEWTTAAERDHAEADARLALDDLWRTVERLSKTADEKDQELFRLLRSAASMQQERRLRPLLRR